ncbi:MAG: SGNH/GDSL hydrolase family protein [Planctomycetes bacterium]|nr:SGNH/GDSL hydrolase family protein [Planctomycetota bacterium]
MNTGPANRRWRFLRSRRVAVVMCSLALAAFIGTEFVARFVLGLGDPPLFVADPKIEYLNKPGHYHRFGHIVHVNQWSMRSPDFPQSKASPNELRVLVIGDSVVNGGAKLDNSQVATDLFARDLATASGRPVIVGNISAGSWGPQNELAYLEKFGTFDADAAIVVWSSHDAWDIPGFGPFAIDQPTEKPILASYEAFRRYAIPMIVPPSSESPAHSPQDVEKGVSSARKLLELIQSKNIPVAVILHKTQKELNGAELEGDRALAGVAESLGVPVFQTASLFAPAVRSGRSVFFDDIHPNAEGNRLLADLYLRVAADLLAPQAVRPDSSGAPVPPPSPGSGGK